MANIQTSTNQQCHVHDKAHDVINLLEIPTIRKLICAYGGQLDGHDDGNKYCQFHFPKKEKPSELFNSLFKDLLADIEKKIASEKESLSSQISTDLLFKNDFVFQDDKFEEMAVGDDPDELWEEYQWEHEERMQMQKTTYDFRYVWFPAEFVFRPHAFTPADFRFTTFCGKADFSTCSFPEDVDFSDSTFRSHANFTGCVFNQSANFRNATFESTVSFLGSVFLKDVNLQTVTFSGLSDFSEVTFCSKANFNSMNLLESAQLSFKHAAMQDTVDFDSAMIEGYLHFEAGKGFLFTGEWLDIGHTRPKKYQRNTSVFENDLYFSNIRSDGPNRIRFSKVRLCPSWFVNSDPRTFNFTDASWENHLCGKTEIAEELDSLSRRGFEKGHGLKLLIQVLHNLATNSESFNRFDDASNFRKAAFECENNERSQKSAISVLIRDRRSYRSTLLHKSYRWLSFYGESWSRAALVLIGVLFFFGLLYNSPFATFEKSKDELGSSAVSSIDKTYKMNNSEGVVYSLYVAALQRPEPKPADTLTRFFVIVETILAPLQAALLALAIRRKFMR